MGRVDIAKAAPSPPPVRAPLSLSTAAFSLSNGLSMQRTYLPSDGGRQPAPSPARLQRFALSFPSATMDAGFCGCGKASTELFVRQVMDPKLGLVQLCDLCGLSKRKVARVLPRNTKN
jgi:hypothetical protein